MKLPRFNLVLHKAQAVAVSPIPGPGGNRANVVITIAGGPAVARSSCSSGAPGFPFTVEIAESTGIAVTFDSTFVVDTIAPILGALRDLALPISYLGTGQAVPEDLQRATASTLAAWATGDGAPIGALAS